MSSFFHRVKQQMLLQGIPYPSATMSLHLQNYLREVRRAGLAVTNPYLLHIRYEIDKYISSISFPNRIREYELRDDKAFKGTIALKNTNVIERDPIDAPPVFLRALPTSFLSSQ